MAITWCPACLDAGYTWEEDPYIEGLLRPVDCPDCTEYDPSDGHRLEKDEKKQSG